MTTTRGRIGSMIRDKYLVDRFIATGSMANVYAATHRNGSRVALKVLHPELAKDPNMTERFKREGWFANAIGHPGIVRAIDDDVTDDGCPFIVMELLEGENLEARRKRVGGRLPLGEVLKYADAVLDVLAAAHARDVLHRDLKPENVFVTHDGALKLLDFGVARWNDGKGWSDVTGVGMVLGTPAYMPPEQALGRREEVDARSDLWALGATLFTLLTGEPVHTGDTARSKLIATARTPARKLRDVAPNVPRAVAAVIDRALEFDRDARWDDALAMREALRWARMSIDSESGVPTTSVPEIAVPTRRAEYDEPTVLRSLSQSDEVYTSAPPITKKQEEPASVVASSEGPVFSLRTPSDDEEASPSTERDPAAQMRSTQPGPPTPADDEPPPSSTRVEYTRPLIALPAEMRRTLPMPVPAVQAPVVVVPAASVEPASRATHPPGPLLSQVAPKKPVAARVLVPLIVVGILGGSAAFLALKRREAESRAATTDIDGRATETATPSASVAPPAVPPPVASLAAPPPPSATATTTTTTAATTARPRPRAKPSATPSARPAPTPSAAPSALPSTAPSAAPKPPASSAETPPP